MNVLCSRGDIFPRQKLRQTTTGNLPVWPQWRLDLNQPASAKPGAVQQANVTGLEWSQVDLVRKVVWIHPDQAKARKAIKVPLNHDAVDVIRRQIGRHSTRVFTYRGKPITQVTTKAWRKALDRTGIRMYDDELPKGHKRKRYPTFEPDSYKYDDFRWHDLRHTWASWHVQAGTPLHVFQELGGWASMDMVQRYPHLSAEHLADYARNIESERERGAKLVAVQGD